MCVCRPERLGLQRTTGVILSPVVMSHQNWCFTLYTETPLQYDESTMGALIQQREQCPKTQRLHWQGCVKWRCRKSFTAVKRILGDTHIEPCRDWNASVKYCTKKETRVPGTEPLIHGEQPTDWRSNTELQLWDTRPDWMLRNWRGVKAYRTATQQPPSRETQTVLVYLGPPGSGKSHTAHTKFSLAYSKDNSIWWDGYANHEHIVWDDFSGSIPFRDLLRILDIYPMRVQVKGGYTNLTSKTICITCNKHPQEWYPNQDYTCIKRRIHELWQFSEDFTCKLMNELL